MEDPDSEDDGPNGGGGNGGGSGSGGSGGGGTTATTSTTVPGDAFAPDLAATVVEDPNADDAAAAAAVGGTVTPAGGTGGGKDKDGKDKKDKKDKEKEKPQQGEKAARSARAAGQGAGKKRVVMSNVVSGGGSLEYSVDATGVKEKVRLNDVPDGTGDVVYRFPFVADGLAPKLVGNQIDFVDSRGVVAWSMPRGVAWDSKGGVSTPANQFVDVAYGLETRKGRGFELVVTLPRGWVRDPARVFPVFVDPSISYGVGSGAIVSASQPGQWIGTNSTTGLSNALQFGSFYSSTWEAYARFDTTALSGSTVANATLAMSLINCGKTGVDQNDPIGNYVDPILIGALSGVYDPATVTYSIKPGVGAQLSFPTGTGYGPRPVSFNITSLVNGWAASPGSNFGLSFQMGSGDEYCVLDLGASALAVDYTPPVAVNTAPTVTATAPVAAAAVVGVPTFTAAPVDAEGDPISLFFQVCTGADAETGTCVTSGWLGTGITSWTPPAGALVSGGTYYWKVLAASTGLVSAWTAVRSFSMVNLPATITPVGPPSGAQLPGTPTFDVSVTDPENDPFNVYFRVCTGTDGETGSCVSSDWLAPGVVSWAPPGGLLTRGVTYYWHAKAASNGVETPWTPVWSFTFVDRPPVVGLVTPLTGIATDAIPELITTASDPDGDATLVEYRVCLSADAETDCVVSPTTGTTWQVPADELAVNTQYFWKARAIANGVYSPWSEIRSFVTSIPNTDPTALAYGYSPYLTIDSGGDAGGGVNGATGVFVRTDKDAQIPSIGKLLGVARTYNSGDSGADVAGARAFGYAWSSVLDMKLVEQTDGVIIRYPDGRREWHGRNPNGTYASQQGFYSTLTKPNTSRLATWRLTLKDFTTFTFDRNGRLSQITDEAGHPVDFTMTNGRIVSMIDRASGRSLNFTYNGAAHVIRVDETPLTFGGANNPVTMSWTYTYVGNKLTKVCDPRGAQFCRKYEYTPTDAKLSQVLKPNGNIDVAVTYVPNDVRVQTRTDGVGNVTTYTYFPQANGTKSVRTTDARGFSTTDFYDATFNRLVQSISKDGKFYVTSYNAYGFVSSTGGSEVKSFVTDERGNVVASTDERANTTINTFWPASTTDRRSDKLKTVTSPLGKVSSFDYDPATGRPTVTTNAAGSTITTYTTGSDPAQGGGVVPIGLPKTVTSRGGRSTTYTYNRAGDAVLTVNAAGLRTQVGYDEHGKAVSETQLSDTFPAGVTTQTVYNAVGQIIRITGPRIRNRITGVDHQAQTANTYNANGDLTDELTTDIVGNDQNRRTRHTYDGNDREISTLDAEGNTVRREFNATGQVGAVVDARGVRTETEFDSRGVAQKVTLRAYSSPAGGTTHDIVLSEVLAFDPIGRIFQQRDASGRITEHTYWPGGLPLETTIVNYVAGDTADPNGAPLTTVRQFSSLDTYDDDGLLTQQVTSGGLHSATMTYDGAGRVVETTTDAVNTGDAQTVSRQTLDGDGLVLFSTLQQLFAPALPAQSLYEYDPAGRATKVTTKNTVGGDIITLSTYDQRGIATSVTDARGNVTDTLSDESGRPYEVRLPAVSVEENGGAAVAQRPITQIGYNTFGNTTNGKDARGNITAMVYDRLGRKTRIDHPNAGQGLNNVRELFTYDASGNLASQTDKRGNVTSYEYDTRNEVARTVLPVLVGGNGGSGVQTVLYDDAGRPVATTDQSGASGTVSYNNMGQAILAQQLVRAAGGQPAIPTVVRMAYDLDGFMIKRVSGSSANPKTELFTPSPQGQLAESVDPNTGTTRIVRNQLGQPRSVQQNNARRVDTTYDQAGRALASQLFGDDGLLVSGSTQTLDPAGNPVTMTSARGAVTTYTYDPLGRVTLIVSPAGSQSYGYDAVGNLTRSTDGRNNSTVTTFNAWNLATATIEPSTAQDPSPGQRTFTTSYDRGGLPVQSVEPGNVQTVRSFDAWNQLTTENATQPVPQGPGVQKQYGYDSSGRLARVSSPSGDSTYTYDDRGLLVAAAGVGGTASMAYNERGLPTSRTDSSGTAAFGWQPARDQLATITDSTGGTRSYAWNSFGQLSAESYGTALRQYGYDTAGRLSTDSLKDAGGASLVGFAYSYDVSGNVASKTVNLPGNSQSGIHMYEYDFADRLTKWTINGAVTPYQYDAAGNRTQAGTATYTYDARNRLQTGPNETYSYSSRGALRQSTKNGVATTFTVDAAGRTAQSVVAGQAPVNYQYDGLDRVLNRNGAAFTYTGTAMDPTSDGTTTFSRGPDGTPLWLTKAGATVAAGMDRHGDLAFTLNANLTVGSTSVYDPFGVPTVKTGPGTAIGFQADWTEPSTGNVWMGARWYTPSNASFTTRDTYAGNPSTPVSLNRYTYGSNNPIRYSDPTGHYSVEEMGSNLDFSYLAGLGGSSGSGQNLTNAELWDQYQSTGYIPDDNPINTTTTIHETSDGSVVIWNPSSQVGGLLGTDGSSIQFVGDASPVYSGAGNESPVELNFKTFEVEESFSDAASGIVVYGWWDPLKLPAKVGAAIASGVGTAVNVTGRVAAGAWDGVKGIGNMIVHPIQTAEALGKSVLAVNSCANGDCEELIKMGKVMVSGCSQDYARCAGRLAFDVLVAKGAGRAAAAVAEAKVVANAARVAKAAEAADVAAEAIDAAKVAAAATKPGPSLSGRLVLEDADKAISLARRATPEAGYFDVIGHGTPFEVSGLTPQQVAAQIRNTPSWGGQNVRLIACQTGCPVSTFSQTLANELGVTVKAANVDIFPQYSGQLKLGAGGSWFTYTPK